MCISKFFRCIPLSPPMNGWLLEIETPKNNWCQDAVRAFPDHRIGINLIVPSSGDGCIESVSVMGPEVDTVVDYLKRHEHVVSVLETGRDRRTVQLRLTLRGCPVANVMRETGLAPRLPFVVIPGKDIWMVVGQDAALQSAQKELARHSMHTRVVGKGDWTGQGAAMTEHQRHVLTRAIDSGYYEYPRRTSLTGLAGQLGVAKSTLSQTLMVIEMKMAFDFMERPPRASDPKPDAPRDRYPNDKSAWEGAPLPSRHEPGR